MARWLPEQLAGAGNAGMSGQKGIARVIAMNQLARTTAGSADQAGNNVSNLIGKLKSSDTLTAFNKKFDIDLTDRYKKGMLEGKDTMEVFADTLTEIVGKDKKFAQAVKMAEKAKAEGDKSAATWEQISSVMEGSVVGQVIRDKEAGMALTAYMSNRELGQEIYQKVLDAQGVVDDNFQLVQEGSGYKTQQGQNEKDIKTQEAFEPFNNLLGVAAEKLVEFSQAFPQLSTWLTGAGYTGMALGAVGIGGGVFMKATGMSLPFFGGAGAGTGAGAAAGTGTSGWLTGMLSKLFSSRVLGSVGLLLHSESLNAGEYERILEMRRKQAEANGVDAKRQALGIGPELAKQAGDAITQSGHAMLVQTQAVGQALITQVGATKIEGNINVNVSAAPGLNVWTSSVGNGNTQLNVGKTNTAAK